MIDLWPIALPVSIFALAFVIRAVMKWDKMFPDEYLHEARVRNVKRLLEKLDPKEVEE